MRYKLKQAAVLLLLLPALLLAACAGKETVAPADAEQQAFDDLRAAVSEVIEDPAQQARLLNMVDEGHAEFTKLRTAVEVRRTELRTLNADYDATREQFREYVEKYDNQIKVARKLVTQSRLTLVQATTEQEWDALEKASNKAMKKMIRVIQSL